MTKTIAVVLMVVGLIGLIWGGITYRTQKKVIDLGPIQATQTERHRISVPPIAGGIALVGGIVLLLTGRK